MSFRELHMIDIREILRRWQAGQSARQMARDGVVDRKTALRYIHAAKACSLQLHSEVGDEQIAKVAACIQARPAAERSKSWQRLLAQRARIEGWLHAPEPLRLIRVQELLARDGIEIAYTTLRRFAHEVLGWRERSITVRIEDAPPGEEAQIDFGLMGWVHGTGGTRRKLWVLIVTLSMSRYMFVWPTFVQTTEAVCEGLDAAWHFFAGVAKRIVPDNMRAIVIQADAKQPVVQRAFAEYAQVRGFFIDPARVRRPKDKGRVENQVPYVRERWFAGETFSEDLHELRRHAER